MGTSTSGIAEGEASSRVAPAEWRVAAGFRYSQQEIGNLATLRRRLSRADGPAYTIATACSSSAKAFASAQRLIAAGLCDAAVVGGADTLCRMTLNGFDSLEALAQDYCNPFSRNRDGINIGEGAAVFPDVARAIAGGAARRRRKFRCVSRQRARSRGRRRRRLRCCARSKHAGLTARTISLHQSARHRDGVERRDGRSRGRTKYSARDTPCSSTKSMTGHMLGAAGATEAAFLWLTLEPRFRDRHCCRRISGMATPIRRYRSLNLAPLTTASDCRIAAPLLSNSFAFGGSNASVILGRGW